MTKSIRKVASVLAWDPSTENVVHINLVAEGFKGAECRVCKEKLTAANRKFDGRIKAFYFSHRQGSECSGEAESLAHLWAKQIIAEQKALLLPGYETELALEDWEGDNKIIGRAWSPGRRVELTRTQLEHRLVVEGEIRTPDVTAYLSENVPLFVEVHVANPVDSVRGSFYRRNHLNCLEIHVKECQGEEWQELLASPDRFREHVIEKAHREWVSCNLYPDDIHAALDDAMEKARIEKLAQEREAERRLAQDALKAEQAQEQANVRQQVLEQIARKLVRARQEQWREKRRQEYLQQVIKPRTKSAKVSDTLIKRFGLIPAEVNVPVPDELAFWEVHRCVWQWAIYEFLVIEPYQKALKFEAQHGVQYWRKPLNPGGDILPKNWVQADASLAKYRQVTPGDACRRLYKKGVKSSPLTEDVAKLLACGAEEIPARKPRELTEINDQDWEWVPKPALAVQHYLRALRDKGILYEFETSYGSQGLGAFQLKGRQTPPLA
ncbi:MAG: hypothetical protein P1U67_00885 [Alcanivoracaceae bacterium]|nr:hypothetical protein [Alcanivoracaceae bacterium]